MPRQPEGKLVSATRKLLRDRGARPFKIQGDGENFQEVGIPDLLCCYRGRFLGLEAKMRGGNVSAKQKAVLNEIAEAGGIAAVFTTVGQVSLLLGEIDQEVAGAKKIRRPVNPYRFYGATTGGPRQRPD